MPIVSGKTLRRHDIISREAAAIGAVQNYVAAG
jgi:hypothetical protein